MKIVVIGAGVGGATAAALLAKAGHDVTVLEAHVYAGGCAGTFYHQKYRFDVGATLAGGFQTGGPHDIVAKRLGIEWRVEWVEPAWQVHLPDRVITQYGDHVRWHEESARAFADSPQRDKILRFFRQNEQVSDAVWAFAARRPAWPPANIGDLIHTGLALRPDTLVALPHLFETTGAWARRTGITDRAALTFLDAQLLISAQTTSNHASALFGAAATDLPRKGVAHPSGGIGGLSEQLVESIRANGGAVHFRQEVTRLEVKDNQVVAAHTNKGERFACDLCIANLTPWNLAQLLGEATPAKLHQETQQRPDQWGAFMVYLGVEDRGAWNVEREANRSLYAPRSPPHDSRAIDHHQLIRSYDAPLGETNSIFMSLSAPGDLRRAPAGHRALTISTHTRTADWWALRNAPDGGAAYEARKAEYMERMIDQACTILPNLRARIRLKLAGTPITFRFYTRRHNGGVGGFPFTSLFKARGPWTGLSNTWLVGDSIFPGQSTAGVTMGALRVVDEVTRRL